MSSTQLSNQPRSPAQADIHAGAFVNLLGVRLWYVDSGGAGTPVVLLHANTGTVEAWRNQIEVFAKAGLRVIAFDRRGWGKSTADPVTGDQPSSVAEDLDALADHLDLPSFHLVGIAGGGFVALDYAAWRPERLRRLIVAASNGQFKEPEMQAFYDRIAVPGLTGNADLRMYLEVGVSYRAEDPEGLARFVQMEHAARQPAAPPQPMRTPNTFAKISTIQARTLIISGGADLLAPPSLMRFWARHLRNATLVNIPDAGHSLNWERPQEFNAQVLCFLQALD
ncbi:MAG: alpha/beta hydrolase [Polaromonas sp.]|nr:alpha/beta hydrolase [Polaromonas sp.]